MNEKARFVRYLRKQGFVGNTWFNSLDLIPEYRVSPNGNHYLISTIRCCLFDGVNTKPEQLGCVTFYYGGKYRRKYTHTAAQTEIQKKAFCPETSKAAIEAFNIWIAETRSVQETWKIII